MTREAKKSIDIVSIQMVKERRYLYNNSRLTAPQQAAEAFTQIIGDVDREYFVTLFLDGKNRITGLHVVSQGSLIAPVIKQVNHAAAA